MKISFVYAVCGCSVSVRAYPKRSTMDQIAREMVLVELVKGKISQVVVGDLLGKHVIGRNQDLMGYGHRSARRFQKLNGVVATRNGTAEMERPKQPTPWGTAPEPGVSHN